MGDVLTFQPRSRPSGPEISGPLSGAELRTQIEAGVQAALDLADHYIAVLNGIDGCPDLEDGGDAEQSLAAPENAAGSQVTWLRGNDQDRETEAPETVLPEVAAEMQPEPLPEAVVLPWRGRGNVIAAAGVLLVDMVVRR